jgi:hypothetical protein
MATLKGFSFLLLLLSLLLHVCQAEEVPHKLAVGTTYIGAQLHWGFAEKWAVEARVLTGEAQSSVGNVTSTAAGLRGYRYFRRPSRIRFFMGLEAASTRSYSKQYDYETSGVAFGVFGGTELYLLRRLSVGVDVGPYLLSSKVRNSNTGDANVSIVINSFMNFYFL